MAAGGTIDRVRRLLLNTISSYGYVSHSELPPRTSLRLVDQPQFFSLPPNVIDCPRPTQVLCSIFDRRARLERGREVLRVHLGPG